jgi:hypothetical protein
MSEVEVRKLPKKTIIIITILSVLTLITFLVLQSFKEQKLTEIISGLGHKNIKNMQVVNKMMVEDKITRHKSKVYKVKFFDNELNKTCMGFIHFKRDKTHSKDIDCK